MAQVPAIIYDVVITTFEEGGPFHSSIMVYRVFHLCPCCGGPWGWLDAVWDFDFDRCMDFHLKYGEYANHSDLILGQELYMLESKGGRSQ